MLSVFKDAAVTILVATVGALIFSLSASFLQAEF